MGGLVLSAAFCTAVMTPLLHMHVYEPLAAVVLALLVAVLAVRALGQTDLNPVSGVGKLSQVCPSLYLLPHYDMAHAPQHHVPSSAQQRRSLKSEAMLYTNRHVGIRKQIRLCIGVGLGTWLMHVCCAAWHRSWQH